MITRATQVGVEDSTREATGRPLPALVRFAEARKLEEMRVEHVRKAIKESWPLFLPIGTIEYHCEHLPLGVDGFAVISVLKEVEKRILCL